MRVNEAGIQGGISKYRSITHTKTLPPEVKLTLLSWSVAPSSANWVNWHGRCTNFTTSISFANSLPASVMATAHSAKAGRSETTPAITRRLPIGAEVQPSGGVHFRVHAPIR